MRKKIIRILYHSRFLRLFLPLFHVLIGKNRMSSNRQNSIHSTTANLYKNKFDLHRGTHNAIYIGDNADLHNSSIIIKGSNNHITIGNQAFVNGITVIMEGDNNSLIIDDRAFILDRVRMYIVDGSMIKIGPGCMLSDQIEMRTTDNHSILDLSTNKRINPEQNIILHSNVWIGTRATLLKGTELPDGCIVGAGSLLAKKYDTPNTILAGVPAKEIRNNVAWKMERVTVNQ